MEDAHDRDVLLAWHIEMFARVKKLGDPRKWFAQNIAGAAGPQTVGQQKVIAGLLGDLGLRVTTRAQREAEAAKKAARARMTKTERNEADRMARAAQR